MVLNSIALLPFLNRDNICLMDSAAVRIETIPIENKLNWYVVFWNQSLSNIQVGVFRISVEQSSYSFAISSIDHPAMLCGSSWNQATILLHHSPIGAKGFHQDECCGCRIPTGAVDSAYALSVIEVKKVVDITARGIVTYLVRARLVRVSSERLFVPDRKERKLLV